MGLTLLGPLTSSVPSTETWGSGEVFERKGWGERIVGSWREGGALVTFTFQAHLSREGAGTHLQRQDGSHAPSSAPETGCALGLRDSYPPEDQPSPLSSQSPRQKCWQQGQSRTAGPLDDSITAVIGSRAQSKPAAAPLPQLCPPPTCSGSAASFPSATPPRQRHCEHVLCYL